LIKILTHETCRISWVSSNFSIYFNQTLLHNFQNFVTETQRQPREDDAPRPRVVGAHPGARRAPRRPALPVRERRSHSVLSGAQLARAKGVPLYQLYDPKCGSVEFGHKQYYALEWSERGTGMGDGALVTDTEMFAELVAARAGTFHYYFVYDEPIARAADGGQGSGWFAVTPSLPTGAPLDALVCQTVLAKCLGPLPRWRSVLEVAHRTGYNLLHFTPLQVLGASDSSYSIADQLKLDPRYDDPVTGREATFADVQNLITTMHEEWQMMAICDVVLNHTANETAWLRTHRDASYNCANCPHLRPAAVLDALLARLTADVADGLVPAVCGSLPARLDSPHQLDALRPELERRLCDARLHEFFCCDVDALSAAFLQRAATNERPLVARYFTLPELPDLRHYEDFIYGDQGCEVMAHNGWVMNADPLRDFAAREEDGRVYLRRELIAWGDSVKLRYGAAPEDSPFLWEHMRRYVELTARVFDGLRLDNCHSTPLHVAEHLLQCGRRVKPDLYVVAELFTNCDRLDNIFVNRLGITSLIRGAFRAPAGGARAARAGVAHAALLDLTHDNPSPVTRRSVFDLLPTAALVAAAACAVGSTRGYDDLVPHHVNVRARVPLAESAVFERATGDGRATELHFRGLAPGDVVALRVRPEPATAAALAALAPLTGAPAPLTGAPAPDPLRLAPALADLTLSDFNVLLYCCEAEERERCGGGVYDVPGAGPLAYAGLAGAHAELEPLALADDLAHPLCANLRAGDWLPDYTWRRLEDDQRLAPVAALYREALQPLAALPRFLVPCYFELVVRALYTAVRAAALARLGGAARGSRFARELALTSVQLTGGRPSAPLPRAPGAASLSAGLPHFAVGYMRCWGRDTFIALRGAFLLTGREADARAHILAFAASLRHGLIPNLLDGGRNARYNCRDAGVVFRERNAGRQIDAHMTDKGFNVQIGIDPETGFPFGGNDANCGTWMDKMGSSERAGNRGRPATPRDGSAVELVALAYSTAAWLAAEHRAARYPHPGLARRHRDGGVSAWTWPQWAERVRRSFERHFWVPPAPSAADARPDLVHRRAIYKDSHGASQPWADYQLRCNFPVAMAVAPDLFEARHAWAALETAGRLLAGPLGLKTLDPADWNYRGDYDNSDDGVDPSVAHGFNYHQGPEWVWPLGFYLRARLEVARRLGRSQAGAVLAALGPLLRELRGSPWRGLPELTGAGGAYCRDSCRTQFRTSTGNNYFAGFYNLIYFSRAKQQYQYKISIESTI
ncbi:unnamed protein product, partial [Leptidea sinapis]